MMDLNFTQDEEAFRAEVRAFLADKLPSRLSDKVRNGVRLSKARERPMGNPARRSTLLSSATSLT